jgi:hypothetical protein
VIAVFSHGKGLLGRPPEDSAARALCSLPRNAGKPEAVYRRALSRRPRRIATFGRAGKAPAAHFLRIFNIALAQIVRYMKVP